MYHMLLRVARLLLSQCTFGQGSSSSSSVLSLCLLSLARTMNRCVCAMCAALSHFSGQPAACILWLALTCYIVSLTVLFC